MKATQFRQNLFSVLDQVRDSGAGVEIERGGEKYLLTALGRRKSVGSVEPRPWICAEPEGLESFSPARWSPDDLS